MTSEQINASRKSNGFLTVYVDKTIVFEFIEVTLEISSVLPKKNKSPKIVRRLKIDPRPYSERFKNMRESNRLLQSASLTKLDTQKQLRRTNSFRGGKRTRKYKRRSLRKPK
jgi:hypothetical protein